MPCTPALFSQPVEQAQVQVVEGGTREGEGTNSSSGSSGSSGSSSSSRSNCSNSSSRRSSCSNSSSSNTVTQNKIVGTILAQINFGREDRFLLWVGYLPIPCQGLCRRCPRRRWKIRRAGVPHRIQYHGDRRGYVTAATGRVTM